ncbi:hypothetical protein GE061_017732 [Apolygus lucorum]|uniref:Uncharacterized protein n=1 Tax=Apolygus lucorum TaxID=248454 RepID=A0A8S9XD44_APOLU|nr:hypothetical protein GE061_017732 [Apolygus lucorum]
MLSRHDLLRYDENKNSKERDVDSSLDSSQLHSIEASLPSFFFSPSTEAIEESRDHESMLQGYSTIENPGLQTSEPSPSSSLNSNDLFKLCGSQGKHLSSEMIRLIEIDGSKLANSSELKTNNMKSLTYDYNALYRQHKFKSSRRERTKHQITYLVEHAKFFEREVTNYPKNSKISQKRYGF